MAENPYGQFVRKKEENPYARFAKAPASPRAPEKVQMFPKGDYLATNKYGDRSFFSSKPPERPDFSDDPFTVALGGGLKRTIGGLTRLALPKGLEPDWASDEARQEDKVVRETYRGQPGTGIGGLAGETIPTLPLGGPIARGGSALQAAARSLPGVLRLTRAVGSAPVRTGVEGAIDAAATADVGEEQGAAGTGAAVGSGLSVLGKLGGVLRKGFVNKSQEAQDLAQLAQQHGKEIFQPVAQAGSDDDVVSRLTKSLYRELLPLVPGTSGRLQKQGQGVLKSVREMAAEEATPTNYVLRNDPGTNMGAVSKELRDEFNKRYLDTVKSYAFNVPNDFRQQVVARIKQQYPNVDDVTLNKVATLADEKMARFSSGKPTIEGSNLLEVKNAIGDAWKTVERPARGPVEVAQDLIDEIIETELRVGNVPSNLADLQKFQELTAPYRSYGPLRKAARAAKGDKGNFTPSQLARHSPEGSTMLDLAQTARGATKDAVVGRTPRWIGAGGIGAMAVADPMSALGTLVGGQVLSTELFQKAIMGDLAAQKTLQEFANKNPQAGAQIGQLLRSMATTQTGSNYGQ